MALTIVGHRGVAAHYPENTRVSIQAAIDLGLNWVEVDVQPTKDNILVVCHDHTINRCSDGRGRIDRHTFAELTQHDFGYWFAPQFTGEPLLTLSELLQMANQHHLNLNIEVKVDRHHDVNLVVKLLKAQLASANLTHCKLLLSSFSHAIMRELHQQLSNYPLGVLTSRITRHDIALLDEIDAFSCHTNYQRLRQQHVDKLKQTGRQIWCYTVNDGSDFPLLDQVDAIFSDDPAQFL
ncbi:glycerophosphoryl diester phosphodiesterase [Vibrio sp. CAIM 722]|uniref:Glycerophosphoryl diester phosphodiesterase n=1 Tax=Vibrio eleionomae TaxID=2653505 RepID=A0A7X4LL48_9VIBR|nr:glycerophosphodiester phosphodiesterase family protein [Vibrio eleionomae]MZI93899.1 glycerophosphoryl diester phosphodiesterase [Vibrio eleionomae]